MGNFLIQIEATGGHGSDRNARQYETLSITDGPDKMAQDFVKALAASGCSVVWASLTHWPESDPIVDDLKNNIRRARDFVTPMEQEWLLQFFTFSHLREELQAVSRPFCHMAHNLVATLPRNPERTVALRALMEAKDAAVRAALAG